MKRIDDAAFAPERPCQGLQTARAGARLDGAQALAARMDKLRIAHTAKAMACAQSRALHGEWLRGFRTSLARLRDEERAFEDHAAALDDADTALTRCLIDAMELARSNGDPRAAEAVAMECMTLLDLHCARMLGEQATGMSLAPADRAGDAIRPITTNEAPRATRA